MKIITANKESTALISKIEWLRIGKRAGWIEKSSSGTMTTNVERVSQPINPNSATTLLGKRLSELVGQMIPHLGPNDKQRWVSMAADLIKSFEASAKNAPKVNQSGVHPVVPAPQPVAKNQQTQQAPAPATNINPYLKPKQ